MSFDNSCFLKQFHITIVQDTCRMGVWLGWHICYNATQVSQGQLRENRNLSWSIRAKAVLIYVLSVTVHNEKYSLLIACYCQLVMCESTAQRSFSLRMNSMVLSHFLRHVLDTIFIKVEYLQILVFFSENIKSLFVFNFLSFYLRIERKLYLCLLLGSDF